MSEKSHSTLTAARGRPRSFDLDRVADTAMLLFWKAGYEDTNLTDITAATGVNASSLYAAFTSKQGLFRAALDRYQGHVDAALQALASGTSGIDDVVGFVEWIRTSIISTDHPNGCLIVNTMVEFADHDPDIAAAAARYREHLQAAIRRALQRAERSGEIRRGSSSGRALVIQAALFGALVTGRSGAIGEADEMLRNLTVEVRHWRTAT